MNNISNKKLLFLELCTAILTAAMAFLFHIIYELSGNNFLVGLFTSTNESVFEHTKILFYPYLLLSFIEYFLLEVDFQRYFVAKTVSSIFLIVIVIVFFYTYTGIIGYHIPIIDMVLAIAYPFIAILISYKIITSKKPYEKYFSFMVIFLIVILIAMLYFSVKPPQLMLFYDMQGKFYGMKR